MDCKKMHSSFPVFLTGVIFVILLASGCATPRGKAAPPASSAAAPTPAPEVVPSFTPLQEPTPAPEAQPVRLRTSPGGGVLILEEETPAGGEGNPPAAPPEGDYDPFQDHFVKVYAKDSSSALGEAVSMAIASGGQVIGFAVKGFENVGPNERVLVFDVRTYPEYLKKLESLGRMEYQPLKRSDYVTVRLTILPGESPVPTSVAPEGDRAE